MLPAQANAATFAAATRTVTGNAVNNMLNVIRASLYPLNNLIGLDRLNLNFVHYKKLAKLQFLKNGNT